MQHPVHRFLFQAIERQRGDDPAGSTGEADFRVGRVPLPDFQDWPVIRRQLGNDSGSVVDFGVVVFESRTDLEAFSARRTVIQFNDRPDAFFKEIHQPDPVFRTDVCTRAATEAQSPLGYLPDVMDLNHDNPKGGGAEVLLRRILELLYIASMRPAIRAQLSSILNCRRERRRRTIRIKQGFDFSRRQGAIVKVKVVHDAVHRFAHSAVSADTQWLACLQQGSREGSAGFQHSVHVNLHR